MLNRIAVYVGVPLFILTSQPQIAQATTSSCPNVTLNVNGTPIEWITCAGNEILDGGTSTWKAADGGTTVVSGAGVLVNGVPLSGGGGGGGGPLGVGANQVAVGTGADGGLFGTANLTTDSNGSVTINNPAGGGDSQFIFKSNGTVQSNIKQHAATGLFLNDDHTSMPVSVGNSGLGTLGIGMIPNQGDVFQITSASGSNDAELAWWVNGNNSAYSSLALADYGDVTKLRMGYGNMSVSNSVLRGKSFFVHPAVDLLVSHDGTAIDANFFSSGRVGVNTNTDDGVYTLQVDKYIEAKSGANPAVVAANGTSDTHQYASLGLGKFGASDLWNFSMRADNTIGVGDKGFSWFSYDGTSFRDVAGFTQHGDFHYYPSIAGTPISNPHFGIGTITPSGAFDVMGGNALFGTTADDGNAQIQVKGTGSNDLQRWYSSGGSLVASIDQYGQYSISQNINGGIGIFDANSNTGTSAQAYAQFSVGSGVGNLHQLYIGGLGAGNASYLPRSGRDAIISEPQGVVSGGLALIVDNNGISDGGSIYFLNSGQTVANAEMGRIFPNGHWSLNGQGAVDDGVNTLQVNGTATFIAGGGTCTLNSAGQWTGACASTPPASSGWTTEFECIFSDAGYKDFAADSSPLDGGGYVCGKAVDGGGAQWYAVGQAYSDYDTVVDGGLYFFPNQTSDYWTSGALIPYLAIELRQVVKNYNNLLPIRFSVDECDGNMDSTAYVGTVIAIQQRPAATYDAYHYATLPGWSTAIALGVQIFWNSIDVIDQTYPPFATPLSPPRSDQIYLGSGVAIPTVQTLMAPIGVSLWPAQAAYGPGAGGSWVPSSSNISTDYFFDDPVLLLGAKRAGSLSHVWTKLCAVKIEVFR